MAIIQRYEPSIYGSHITHLSRTADLKRKEIWRLVKEKGFTVEEAKAFLSRQRQAKRAAKKTAKKAARAKRLAAKHGAASTNRSPKKKIKTTAPQQFAGRPPYRSGMSSGEFYRTWEWQRVRYEILRKFGPKCMLCGNHGNHVDHIKPRSRFPSIELDPTNLQILCEPCNVGKSNVYTDDWRKGASPGPPAKA